jgi:glycosyltransferase involved in cell wall biosynthesis
MKVIFLSVSRINRIEGRGIYPDLMRKFRDEGWDVYIVSPVERQLGQSTALKQVDGVHVLNVKTLNIQKTNVLEKGLATILLESQYNAALKKYLSDINFDLILYATPPITLSSVISYLKQKNQNAVSYLLLKDIFPQNAVDLGMFKQSSLLYKYFRRKEEQLYRRSDYIGCMSPANVKFLLKHNKFVLTDRVEVAPNSLEVVAHPIVENRTQVREKFGLPADRPIFIYGGNLGKPQGIPFLIECLEANANRQDCHFVVVGNGTEYSKLKTWSEKANYQNITILSRLPKEDYDLLVQSCDVGLIFLDHRFTIPNYPSRLLSYIEYKMPIIAATDPNTDVGTIAQENGYGYWCESNDVEAFTDCVNKFVNDKHSIVEMGENGYKYLLANYRIENTYDVVVEHINK